MSIKRIALIVNAASMVSIVILVLLWLGSFLYEQRALIGIIFAFAATLNIGALIVEWIYKRGEKAGRKTTK